MLKATCKHGGFTLMELMVSVAIMSLLFTGAFSVLVGYQNFYQSSALKADMHSGLRAATELLEQEIGQAGLVSLTSSCSPAVPASAASCPTLSAAVNASASAQTVAVSSTTGMFMNTAAVGEYVTVDVGSQQEEVQLTGLTATSITGVFANSHAAGAPVSVRGMFPQGILSPGQTGGSSATTLNLIGDVVGDGNLYYVRYVCNPPLLTRSVTNLLTGTSQSAAVNLLDNIAANPGGTACFQYSPTQSVSVSGTTYNFTTTVSLTLTVQTTENDPITGAPVQETKSFLNLVPRNILAGYNLANANPPVSMYFQPNPSVKCTAVIGASTC